MAIKFACPSCDQSYTVNDRDAGKKSDCKICGQRLEVPSPVRSHTVLGALPEPSVPEPEPEPEPIPEPRREYRRDRNEPDDNYRRDEEYRPRRRRRGSGLVIATLVVWGVAGLTTCVIGLFGLVLLSGADNAIQEATVSALIAALLIGAYTLARAADKVLASIGQLMSSRN